MNTAQTSKIFYAIDINMGTTETNANVFLNDGHIRFTTDNYDPVTSNARYEDNSYVTGTWYKDSLRIEGLDTSSILTDIIEGTGYTTLNAWSFSIINRCANGTPYHREIIGLTESYLIGSKVKLYAIIDNKMYARGSWIVSDYALSDTYFKINCDDAFIKDYQLFPKTTIGNVNYPNSPNSSIGNVIPIAIGNIKYAKPILVNYQSVKIDDTTSFPLARVRPNIRSGTFTSASSMNQDQISFDTSAVDRFFGNSQLAEDVGAGTVNSLYCIINEKDYIIAITVPLAATPNMFNGKYLTVSKINNLTSADTNTYIKIKDASIATSSKSSITSAGNIMCLVIDKLPEILLDDGNMYGAITDENIPGIATLSDSSVFVYVWDYINQFKMSENPVEIVNSSMASDKIIYDEGSTTTYILKDDSIFQFNPLTITNLSGTFNIADGTSELYIIPDNVTNYTRDSDPNVPAPTNLQQFYGISNCPKLMENVITWDDQQIDYSWTAPGYTYNTNSMVFNDPITSFILKYNTNTLKPSMFDRIVATPIFNAWSLVELNEGGGWFVFAPGAYSKKQVTTVYGITSTTIDGDILTAPIATTESPICRTRLYSTYETGNRCDSLALPILYSTPIKVPTPVDAVAMTGWVQDNAPNPGELQNGPFGYVAWGSVNGSGNLGFYKSYASNNESMVFDTSLSVDKEQIPKTLWDNKDSNGDIRFAVELTLTRDGINKFGSRISWGLQDT